MKISIELDGVSFSYGEKPVLSEVSVSVATGEFVCLLGPNGAGKTTLAQLIAGELSPTEGRVLLDAGDASGDLTGVGRYIAYLPQDLQDPPFVTVRELVSLGRFNPKRSLGWKVSAKDKEVRPRVHRHLSLRSPLPTAPLPISQEAKSNGYGSLFA